MWRLSLSVQFVGGSERLGLYYCKYVRLRQLLADDSGTFCKPKPPRTYILYILRPPKYPCRNPFGLKYVLYRCMRHFGKSIVPLK